ncbi:MAG: hypothetical protein ABG776_14915, partial [Cyanobacteria bacterium J06555_13]
MTPIYTIAQKLLPRNYFQLNLLMSRSDRQADLPRSLPRSPGSLAEAHQPVWAQPEATCKILPVDAPRA